MWRRVAYGAQDGGESYFDAMANTKASVGSYGGLQRRLGLQGQSNASCTAAFAAVHARKPLAELSQVHGRESHVQSDPLPGEQRQNGDTEANTQTRHRRMAVKPKLWSFEAAEPASADAHYMRTAHQEAQFWARRQAEQQATTSLRAKAVNRSAMQGRGQSVTSPSREVQLDQQPVKRSMTSTQTPLRRGIAASDLQRASQQSAQPSCQPPADRDTCVAAESVVGKVSGAENDEAQPVLGAAAQPTFYPVVHFCDAEGQPMLRFGLTQGRKSLLYPVVQYPWQLPSADSNPGPSDRSGSGTAPTGDADGKQHGKSVRKSTRPLNTRVRGNLIAKTGADTGSPGAEAQATRQACGMPGTGLDSTHGSGSKRKGGAENRQVQRVSAPAAQTKCSNHSLRSTRAAHAGTSQKPTAGSRPRPGSELPRQKQRQQHAPLTVQQPFSFCAADEAKARQRQSAAADQRLEPPVPQFRASAVPASTFEARYQQMQDASLQRAWVGKARAAATLLQAKRPPRMEGAAKLEAAKTGSEMSVKDPVDGWNGSRAVSRVPDFARLHVAWEATLAKARQQRCITLPKGFQLGPPEKAPLTSSPSKLVERRPSVAWGFRTSTAQPPVMVPGTKASKLKAATTLDTLRRGGFLCKEAKELLAAAAAAPPGTSTSQMDEL